MTSENEELSGNPNFQLGGLLSSWPDDSDRHWLERIVSFRADQNQAVFTCATNRGETATVHLTCVAPHALRLTLYPPGVEQTPRRTAAWLPTISRGYRCHRSRTIRTCGS